MIYNEIWCLKIKITERTLNISLRTWFLKFILGYSINKNVVNIIYIYIKCGYHRPRYLNKNLNKQIIKGKNSVWAPSLLYLAYKKIY